MRERYTVKRPPKYTLSSLSIRTLRLRQRTFRIETDEAVQSGLQQLEALDAGRGSFDGGYIPLPYGVGRFHQIHAGQIGLRACVHPLALSIIRA